MITMKKSPIHYLAGGIGFILILAGLYFIKGNHDAHGVWQVLPYACVGFGCAIFGHGIGAIVNWRVEQSAPDVAKQIQIEKNDERNLAISNRAKGKTYDIMIPVFGALMVSFGLMGIDMQVIILMAIAYLFICSCGIYYHRKFQKEM